MIPSGRLRDLYHVNISIALAIRSVDLIQSLDPYH